MITYTNSLDFCPGGVPLFVRLSQYDSNFSLVFNCFSHKGDFTVESGSTAVFREHKPDGNVISIDATVSGTTVTLTPSAANAKQMTAIKGHCECEISLQKNGKELSSANFVLLVEKAPVDIDAVQSDSVVRELYDVADRADEILEAAETVDDAVEELGTLIDPTLTRTGKAAEAKAVGDRFDDELYTKTALTYVVDHYIDLTVDPVDTDNPSAAGIAQKCAVSSCSQGDKYLISAVGQNRGRAWGFLDSDNHVISKEDAMVTVENLFLTAPANAVKLVVNDAGNYTSYKIGDSRLDIIDESILDINDSIDDLNTSIDSLDNSKIDKQQEVTDAGKALIISADGIVLPTEFKAGLTDEAIDALLNCFAHVVWVDEHGQEYYDSLEEALRGEDPASILYQLPEATAFNGTSDYIDTGIKLLERDIDYTICFDADVIDDFSQNGKVDVLWGVFADQSGKNLFYQIWKSGTSVIHQPIQFTNNSTQITDDGAASDSYGCHIRGAMAHVAGSDTFYALYSLDGVQHPMVLYAYNYVATDEPLRLGVDNLTTRRRFFKGRINEFTVYNYAMSDEQVDAYAAGGYLYSLKEGSALKQIGGVSTTAAYGLCINADSQQRRTVGLADGIKPYVDYHTGEPLAIYPIPIPDGAKSCQVVIDPETAFFDISHRIYDELADKYSGAIGSFSWLPSGNYVNFPPGVHYFAMHLQADSQGTQWAEEPVDVKIAFFDKNSYFGGYYNRLLSDSSAKLITGGVTGHDVNGISVNISNTKRRTFGIKTGVRPYVNYEDGTDLSVYPIPVPADAKHVTFSITPNTMYFGPRFYIYDETQKKYVANGADPGWQANGTTIDVPEGSEYLTCNIKADASGSSAFTTEPSAISIVFSQS